MKQLNRVAKKLVISVLLCIFFAPFYVTIIYSFKSSGEIAINKLMPPRRLYLGNFKEVIFNNPTFLIALKNSIITVIPIVILLTIICSMASYVLARNKSKIYSVIYIIFLSGILIPFQCIMLPVYSNIMALGLKNSLFGYIFVRVGFQVPFCIVLITDFVKTIPRDMEEAAHIEGMGVLKTFWRIVFPLMKPINITVIVLNTVFSWNDFYVAITLLQKQAVRTLPLAQFAYVSEYFTKLNFGFAFFLLSMLPMIILYLSAQKNIVSGIMSGAVKG